MPRKKKVKKRARKTVRTPSLSDAMVAVQARKKRKCSDDEWHMLSSIEGSLRKLGA